MSLFRSWILGLLTIVWGVGLLGFPVNAQETIEIEDARGTVTIPANPEVIVALDNRTFETLAAWDIPLAAVPKDVMPSDNPYVLDESVLNIGNHREPNLEMIAAVDPDIVIIGQRFSDYYDEIQALVPEATLIDLTITLDESSDQSPDDAFVNGFIETTLTLGTIFNRSAEAQQLVDEFQQSIDRVRASYSASETIMAVIVSGGEIGFATPGTGRVWGPLYPLFGWESAMTIEGGTSNHQGDDISVEAIAQSNADWILVLDRDAATSAAGESLPAQDVIEQAPALQESQAVQSGRVLYAPADTYTNESIQTYIELFNQLAEAFEGGSGS